MTKSNTTEAESSEPNEGEGNRTAARHYNEGVGKTVQSGKVDEKAREAAQALDGEEGEELRRAEEEAKNKAPSP